MSPPREGKVVTFDVESGGAGESERSARSAATSSRSTDLTVKERLAAVNVAQSGRNPFVNNTPPWSTDLVVQTVLVCIFILPLRLLLFCPSIAIAWILDAVANIGHYVDDVPMPRWRCRHRASPRW